MFDTDTIIFIKQNLTGLHYLVGIISFAFGISPLFMDREKVQKQANVFFIEVSAAVFFLFSISMISLDYLSGKPLFEKNSCVILTDKYIKKIPFKELIKNYSGVNVVKKVQDGNYLMFNNYTKIYNSLKIPEDYKYKEIPCY